MLIKSDHSEIGNGKTTLPPKSSGLSQRYLFQACRYSSCVTGGSCACILEELEAMRPSDLEGLYHEHAAENTKVSRQTFGRILESAHRKVSEALVNGKALKTEGGDFEMDGGRTFSCGDCNHTWEHTPGTGKPEKCPSCDSTNFHRNQQDQGSALRAPVPRQSVNTGGLRTSREINKIVIRRQSMKMSDIV